jgi:hypothetical protein
MPFKQHITRFLVNAPGYAEKHAIYWHADGALILAAHPEQTFAQFMATWDLMGRPDDTACKCAQFVTQFRRAVSASGGRYSPSFRELERAAHGTASNLMLLGMLVDATTGKRSYRGSCQGAQVDPLAVDRKNGLAESVWTRKHRRFQKMMGQVLHDLGISRGCEYPLLSIGWDDSRDPNGPVYSDPSIHGVKTQHQQLQVRVNVHAWDAMRRGWNRIADPDYNPLVGAKLVINPETGLPALCFKCIVVTDKPGVQRFRVGYRRMSLRYTDTGAVVESWHLFHDLRPILDLKNDRY